MDLNNADAVKRLFHSRETRSGCSYSPYVAGADQELEALLARAFLITEHPENESPLTTPPSTPPSSPAQSLQELETEEEPSTDQHSSAAAVLSSPNPTTSAPASVIFSTPPSIPPPTTTSTSPNNASPSGRPRSRKRRTKSQADINREKAKSKRHRRKTRRDLPSIVYSRDPQTLVRHSLRSTILNVARLIPQTLCTEAAFHPAQSGYLGLEKGLPDKRDYTYAELTDPSGEFRFSTLPHDPNRPQPLTSTSGAVMGVAIPGPQNDLTWAANVKSANAMIHRLSLVARFSAPRLTQSQKSLLAQGLGGPTVAHGRRGDHNSLAYGASLGNGQKARLACPSVIP
ncbi:hypothetical protein VNI00_003486 [Paramarasmius palmivorus]|uniref:Uncharacterized protein n=1 Tax=Paramarasmius palmivorus TaxID=297713 RepID=A0AAW0DV76_9AGAR